VPRGIVDEIESRLAQKDIDPHVRLERDGRCELTKYMLNEKDLWISLQDFILAIDGLFRSEYPGRLTPIEGAEDNGASLSYHKVGRILADLYTGNLS
jgi:hypothetical protein